MVRCRGDIGGSESSEGKVRVRPDFALETPPHYPAFYAETALMAYYCLSFSQPVASSALRLCTTPRTLTGNPFARTPSRVYHFHVSSKLLQLLSFIRFSISLLINIFFCFELIRQSLLNIIVPFILA